MTSPRAERRDRRRDLGVSPLRLPGLLLGLGLGGFVDGIVLHQILQWHHLLSGAAASDHLDGLRVNVLADGLFHAVTWVLVVLGLALLWARSRRGVEPRAWAGRVLWGWMLAGWGVFNLVEGVVNHHLLGLHHVRSGPGQLAWDLGFLALGALLVIVGGLLARSGTGRPA